MNKTTEAFEAWWADTGEQSLYALNTTTDNDIKTIAGIAWEAAIREALAETEITTPDVCGEVCARAKLCYGCGKALDEANAKLAEPVKQGPVASVRWRKYKVCEWTATEQLHELLGRYREGQTPLQLYAAPVDAKAIRAEALEEAAKWFEGYDNQAWFELTQEEAAAAIRGLK